MEYIPTTKPHVVDHEAPRHRCPVCYHVCYTTQRQNTEKNPIPLGRPPTVRKNIVELLRQEASYDRPMSGEELQTRLDITQFGLAQAIYRARHIDHAPIKFKGSRTAGEGYYLDEPR
jgi:hypothetical protein